MKRATILRRAIIRTLSAVWGRRIGRHRDKHVAVVAGVVVVIMWTVTSVTSAALFPKQSAQTSPAGKGCACVSRRQNVIPFPNIVWPTNLAKQSHRDGNLCRTQSVQ